MSPQDTSGGSELDMMDAAIYDAIRPLETNHEHYVRELSTLTEALAKQHATHQVQVERLEEKIAETIRRRDMCYVALKAAKGAVSGL